MAGLSLLAVVAAVMLGALIGPSGSGAGAPGGEGPSPPTFDLAASRAGIPTVVVLASCLRARADGEDVPGYCDDVIADEDEIREQAESLPGYYPTPADFGFGSD